MTDLENELVQALEEIVGQTYIDHGYDADCMLDTIMGIANKALDKAKEAYNG